MDTSDSNVKLKNTVFQILDKDGKVIGKLTTDENGKATSEPLCFEKYTVKEIQTPNGYILFRDPIEVEVSSSVQKIKVENTKDEWNIQNIDPILKVATLVLFFRKSGRNE